MNSYLKYMLARLGLFLVILLPLLLIPGMDIYVKLMIALLVSFGLSWFVLGKMRDKVAVDLSERSERKQEQRDKLRAALAGDSPEKEDQVN